MKKYKKFFLNGLISILILATSFIFINALGSKEKKIKVLWWGTQIRHDTTLQAIKLFEAKYPNIKVEPIYTSWQGYFDKVAVLFTGNDAPDVIQMTIQNAPQFLEKNMLTDLNKIKTINLSEIDKTAIDSGTAKGILYGIPLGTNAQCIVYNKELFEQAGAPVPTEKWTWQDFEKAANLIYEKTGKWGAGNFEYRVLENYARSKGGSLYAKDLKNPGFNEDVFIGLMEMAQRMLKSKAMEPIEVFLETESNEENSAFAKGNLGFRNMWTNKIVGVRKTLGKDIEIVVFPGPNNDKSMYINPSQYFSIAETSKLKKEAGSFINFFVTDIEANKTLKGERGVPVSPKVREALSKDLSSQDQKIYKFLDYLSKFSKRPVDPYNPPTDTECKNTMNDVMRMVYYGKLTPQEAGKEIVKKLKDILQR